MECGSIHQEIVAVEDGVDSVGAPSGTQGREHVTLTGNVGRWVSMSTEMSSVLEILRQRFIAICQSHINQAMIVLKLNQSATLAGLIKSPLLTQLTEFGTY